MSIKLNGLTADQLKSLTDFDPQLRSAVMEMFKAVRLARAAVNQYNATIVQIISLLDGTENLPTVTGTTSLAGATLLAEADPGYLISYLNLLVTYNDANLVNSGQMALYTKAAGSINLVGQ